MKKLCRDTKKVEVEIINLQKRCNKTSAKAVAKAALKAPRSEYHFFLREQLEKMAGEEQRNYRCIVSRRWKEIKKDLARLSAYNDRARQMENEAEKPGDDSQHKKTVGERSAVKQPQKAPKTSEFVDTDLDDSDTEDEEEQEPGAKQP